MVDLSGKIDLEKVIVYGDEIIVVLKDKRDSQNLTQSLEHSKVLRSSCDSDFSNIQSSLEDYENKIEECREKTEEAKSDTATEAEIDILQKELEEELRREQLFMEDLRIVANDINDLDSQRICAQERKPILKKVEQDETRAQRMLSMYASVSNVIPDLDDQSKMSGHIVNRDKKVAQKFEFDPKEISSLSICNTIWEMINSC